MPFRLIWFEKSAAALKTLDKSSLTIIVSNNIFVRERNISASKEWPQKNLESSFLEVKIILNLFGYGNLFKH